MPLKKADIAKFKKELEGMRFQIQRSLRGSTEDVKNPDESGGYSQHQADKGTDDFDRTISLEVTSQEYGILKYIDRALQKIDEGTYGVCDITGDEIPYGRLEAVPYAVTTAKAQDMLEKGLL
ncbi:MAG: TraR/DksA family transcriptional regulator [Parachlamydiaceae bacterium]|nr:TraR/DksA family transcriptional regulator [Parachlamydiaceae bacterium]